MLNFHHMSNTIIVQKNSVKSETDKPSSYSPHLFLHSTHIYSVYNAVVFQLLSRLWPFATLWTVAHQPSLSFTISQSRLKLMSIELVMPSNHLIHCYCLLSLLSVFPTIRVFSSESALCDPMDCTMPVLPVLHHLPELAQTHVHQVGDAIQPSCPLSSPSPPAFNLSQH